MYRHSRTSILQDTTAGSETESYDAVRKTFYGCHTAISLIKFIEAALRDK